jgi:hypothetical protein
MSTSCSKHGAMHKRPTRRQVFTYPRAGLLAMLLLGSLTVSAQTESSPSNAWKASKFKSADDGMLDLSTFLDQANGFVPVIIPITEPAVGVGGVLALVFVDKQGQGEGINRPDISAVAGMRTDNGSKGAFLADNRYWQAGQIQTTAALFDAEINLRFYGAGGPAQSEEPREYALATRGGILQGKYRLGDSKNWLGAGYILTDTQARFDVFPDFPDFPDIENKTRSAGLMLGYTFDTRNNVFTPTQGNYLDVSGVLFSESLGSDADFQRASITGVHYRPLSDTWFLGVLGSASVSFGEAPFYLIPAISMRGVPAMSYQGRQVAQVEAELLWQFKPRYAMVLFAGTGRAQDLFERFDSTRDATAGGLGIRYLIAKKYGMHMGADAAYGPDGMAYYVQFGSAWMRP